LFLVVCGGFGLDGSRLEEGRVFFSLRTVYSCERVWRARTPVELGEQLGHKRFVGAQLPQSAGMMPHQLGLLQRVHLLWIWFLIRPALLEQRVDWRLSCL
jgi:hypothetical protein